MSPHRQVTQTAVLVLIGWAILVFGLLTTPQQSLRTSSRRSQCKNNLKQIGLALANYHDRYGSFPPAYIPDANGIPIHSWRVLILPFMDNAPLYDRYDFGEPWNSPKNRQVTSVVIPAYQCPAANSGPPNRTNYVAVIGANTAWPGPKAFSLRMGRSNLIAVVETVDTGIEWAEPRDFALPQMSPHINSKPCCGPASRHIGGIYGLQLDGSVEFLEEKMSADDLYRRLLVEKK